MDTYIVLWLLGCNALAFIEVVRQVTDLLYLTPHVDLVLATIQFQDQVPATYTLMTTNYTTLEVFKIRLEKKSWL